MIFRLLLVSLLSVCVGFARGDSRSAPWVWVEGCNGGRFYLKMIPDAWSDGLPPENHMATAIVYRSEAEDCDTEVWRHRLPWKRVFLSGDGEYVAWVNHSPDLEHVLEFYHRSELVKGFAVEDILARSPKRTAGGSLNWRSSAGRCGFMGGTTLFEVSTSEGEQLRFNAAEGQLVSREKLSEPSNSPLLPTGREGER
jgi:hypothetical protein